MKHVNMARVPPAPCSTSAVTRPHTQTVHATTLHEGASGVYCLPGPPADCSQAWDLRHRQHKSLHALLSWPCEITCLSIIPGTCFL